MPRAKLAASDFMRMFEQHGAAEMARRSGMSVRRIYDRRRHLQSKHGRELIPPSRNTSGSPLRDQHPGRLHSDVDDGVVLVGSDCHYWPGPPSLMHRAFVHFCRELKPVEVVLNGDVVDLGQVSRHPPIGWTKLPTVQEEIEVAQERLHEIEQAAGKARKRWPLGNHDGRFETRLAQVAKEYAEVAGTRLQDHFPAWEPCWSVWINGEVVIKHRYKGGVHATRNNALAAGKTMVTGHLHSARVSPLTDYSGTRYGVDTGCIADPGHRAFVDYTEDNPKDWRDAFAVLTFRGGQLMQPELVLRWDDNHVQFRGDVIAV